MYWQGKYLLVLYVHVLENKIIFVLGCDENNLMVDKLKRTNRVEVQSKHCEEFNQKTQQNGRYADDIKGLIDTHAEQIGKVEWTQ